MDKLAKCPCGATFTKRTNKKYCKPDCTAYIKQRAEWTTRWYSNVKRTIFREEKTCECGRVFITRGAGKPQRWCGKGCPSKKVFHRAVSRAVYQRRRPAAIAKQRDYAMNNPGKIRAWQLSKYGITPDDYTALFSAQNGRCAICNTDTPSKRRVFFDVDHCHTTGKVRGLLCEVCNRSIGLLKDSPELLRRAADYLEK